jgi:predicted lipid-binding transport protein (Tim44 family)
MMRRFLSLIFVTIVVFGLVISDAEAKRFGGGRSIGMSKTSTTNNAYRSANPTSPVNQASRANKWLAPLAGLALGGMLASLFMGHGLGTGILSWLAIAAVIFLVARLWRSRTQMAAQQPQTNRDTSHYFSSANNYASSNVAQPHYPVGFNPDSFLHDAKVQFVRLQAAYDGKNLADIREFTTPEMFAEIHLQLQERGNEPNQTDVVQLDAQLLDAANEDDAMIGSSVPNLIASVRFSGLIKENSDQATSFNEVWHFRKDIMSSRWIVAGVQQQ